MANEGGAANKAGLGNVAMDGFDEGGEGLGSERKRRRGTDDDRVAHKVLSAPRTSEQIGTDYQQQQQQQQQQQRMSRVPPCAQERQAVESLLACYDRFKQQARAQPKRSTWSGWVWSSFVLVCFGCGGSSWVGLCPYL